MNSTHQCIVFKIDNIQKHPNADKLSIVNFYNYQCIIRTEDFKEGDLAVYIPPDNCVDICHPTFEFLGKLGKSSRIKAQKLRGVISQGLVIKAPPGYGEGDDVATHYGITHFTPEFKTQSINKSSERWIEAPPYSGGYYDIDSWYRYGKLFNPGEMVLITEKIHGMNVRYTYQDGEYHVCSRKFWREESLSSIYWQILNERKWLKKLLKQNPNLIVYGEIFGKGIQDLEYGKDKPDFLIFDIYDPILGKWYSWEACEFVIEKSLGPDLGLRFLNKLLPNLFQIPKQDPKDYMVPLIGKFIYGEVFVKEMISGDSLIEEAEHIREGIVIKPVNERWDMKIGRVILKAVSPEYLEKGT